MDSLILPKWPFILGLLALGACFALCLVPLYRRRARLGQVLLDPARALHFSQPDWFGPFCMAWVAALPLAALQGQYAVQRLVGALANAPTGPQVSVLILGALFGLVFYAGIYLGTWLIRTTLIWLLARASGGRAPFAVLLTTVGYASVPEYLLGTLVMAAATTFQFSPLAASPTVLITSLAAFWPQLAATVPGVGVFLEEIELFALWSLVLTIIGTQGVFNFSRWQAAAVVLVYWLAALLASAYFTLAVAQA
ncbi:MAG: hypothetical protein GKR89_09900 [Candidatus Latescibacteria bacterium]|nr:hypothetical protein [Candidatus Latescibacterota bacterium]